MLDKLNKKHIIVDYNPEVIKYLIKPIPKTQVVTASLRDVFRIHRMQKRVYKKMIKDDQHDLFQPSRFKELYLYYRKEMLFIKKDAFGIIGYMGVLPIDNTPYLLPYIKNSKNMFVIDTVVVNMPYRGLGVQKELVGHILSLDRFKGKTWVATAAPDNTFSINNFKALDFTIVHENIALYNNKNRLILQLKK